MVTPNNNLYPAPGFQWGVVFAGTVIALAISLVLVQFGTAIGLADDTPLKNLDGTFARWEMIAVGLWLMGVQFAATTAGGYITGYLRSPTRTEFTPHENELHDGVYGLATWALSTLAVFAMGYIFVTTATTVEAIDGGNVQAVMTNNEQNIAVILAFITGSTAVVSAVISWVAAVAGGDHRHSNEDLSHYYSFKRKVVVKGKAKK